MNISAAKLRPAGLVIAVPAALAPVLAFFAPRGVTPLVVLAALVIVGMAFAGRRRPALIDAPLSALLLALCGWALISALWAPDAWLAARGALKLAGNLFAGAVLFGMASRLDGADARLVGYGLAGGFFLAFGLISVEVLFESPINTALRGTLPPVQWYGYFWLNASASVLSLLVWPLALVLWRRYHAFAAIVAVAAMTALVMALGYATAAAALAVGALFAVAAFAFRRRAATVLAAGFVALVLVMPLAPGTVLKPEIIADAPSSIRSMLTHRLYIWQFTAQKIAQHPLRGWGMNASRTIPGGKQRAIDPKRGDVGENLPLHPHNMMLQIWLELGLPGALLISALGAAVIVRLGHPAMPGDAAAVRMGQMGTVLAISSASFGTWSSWWLCAVWLAAALTAMFTAPATTEP